MLTSSSSKSSWSSIPPIPSITKEEEFNFPEVNLDLQDWKIPLTPTKEIYKTSFSPFSFSSDYNVKTVEQVYAL